MNEVVSRKEEALSLYASGMSKRGVARELGVAKSTVFDWIAGAGIARPEPTKEAKVVAQIDHATIRADILKNSLREAVTKSQWPVINPDLLIVESRIDNVYNATHGEHMELARSPRTYVTDLLRVEPITDYKGRIFFFTRAQNATPVDQRLLANMKAYAKYRGADIVIGPDTYETAWWHETNEDCRKYDPAIQNYLCFGRMDIGPDFFFAGEMNIMTTASTPISDLVSYSMGKWCVVPHSKVQMESIPSTDPNVMGHQVVTTGSITIPKVVPKKAGIKSIFHHVMGFVVAEFDEDGDIFLRHVNADENGSFFDLTYRVENGKVRGITTAERPEYLMPGDIHRAKLDRADRRNVLGTFGFDEKGGIQKDSILNVLKPKHIILQDLHDGEVDSHWTANDSAHKLELAVRGRHMLETEVIGDGNFLELLEKYHPHIQEIIVDESNHDLRLERYIREGRYRSDGFNIRFGLQLEEKYLGWREEVANCFDSGIKPSNFSLHEYAVRRAYPELKRVSWVYDGESRVLGGVEIGHHGFRGSNGSKAALAGYVRFGKKISYGDKHFPAIRDGAYQAGVICMKQGYNKGPSSWAVAHILQYINGKRCIITMQKGKYRMTSKGRPFHHN